MRILILRPGAIGDTLLTFPVIQALRAEYSNSFITLVSNSVVLPLAIEFGLVEEVADYGQLQWSELFSTAGIHNSLLQDQLQQTDFAICWLHDADGIVEHNLRQAGVKRVVIAPGRPTEGKRVHVVDYLMETVELAYVGTRVAPYHLDSNALRPYIHRIAIHPGSGGTQKCWPVSSFAAVMQYLWQHNHSVLLLAGPADAERIATLQTFLSSPPQADLLCTLINAPLVEVAQHLQQCQGYLGNDSGITHLAAMLGIPTVVLFGPSDPLIWRPVGPSVEVLFERVLEQLPVEMVIERLRQCLKA
ncbi:MAG: glycosyltransferase family 9 protein [Ktedonobacteraceae bacterium]